MTIASIFLFCALSFLIGLVMWYSWLICKEAHKLYHIEDKEMI